MNEYFNISVNQLFKYFEKYPSGHCRSGLLTTAAVVT